MTDIELLKCAANAISLEYIECGRLGGSGDLIDRENGQIWNPLTNDGDALRLAEKLGIDVEINYSSGNFDGSTKACMNKDWYVERAHKGNPKAATCRAIVCAAAEIGKQ